MIVPPAVARKHALVQPYLVRVESIVRDIVRSFADDNGLAFVGRLKNTESLAEKIESGRFATWRDLDDLYACCVVVPTLQDESAALDYLRKHFDEHELKGRGATQKDPATFRFDATRFIGRLKSSLQPQGSEDILGVLFEVQIRSAFEHAWSVTTHALAYKAGAVDWRRLRLAAQLKASVEQLDALVLGYDHMADAIAAQAWPEVEAKRKAEAYFRKKLDTGQLSRDFEPRSWLRFCENLFAIVLAGQKGFVRDKVAAMDRALSIIDVEVAGTPFEKQPRSLSLMQLCCGALAKHGGFPAPLQRYAPLVTDELRQLYPETASIGTPFVLEP